MLSSSPGNTLVNNMPDRLNFEAKWLPRMPAVFKGCRIADTSKDERYQTLGVDALVYGTRPSATGLEFKFDQQKTKNFAFEWISQDRPSSARAPQWTDGWMITSHTGWLAYAFIEHGDMFLFNMEVLRSWLLRNYMRFKTTSVGNTKYFSYCSLAPLYTVCNELPREAWHWLNLRNILPELSFSEELKAPKIALSSETPVETLSALFDTGIQRSTPLILSVEELTALHQHLVDNDCCKQRNSVPDSRRKVVLSPLPTLRSKTNLLAA